jgi:hypothetical protein
LTKSERLRNSVHGGDRSPSCAMTKDASFKKVVRRHAEETGQWAGSAVLG